MKLTSIRITSISISMLHVPPFLEFLSVSSHVVANAINTHADTVAAYVAWILEDEPLVAAASYDENGSDHQLRLPTRQYKESPEQ
jgi:hypothetical protein